MTLTDLARRVQSTAEVVAFDAAAVNLAVDTDYSAGQCPKAFRVATGGNVRVLTLAGTDVTLPGLIAGETVRLAVQKIFASGTTATGVVVLF